MIKSHYNKYRIRNRKQVKREISSKYKHDCMLYYPSCRERVILKIMQFESPNYCHFFSSFTRN